MKKIYKYLLLAVCIYCLPLSAYAVGCNYPAGTELKVEVYDDIYQIANGRVQLPTPPINCTVATTEEIWPQPGVRYAPELSAVGAKAYLTFPSGDIAMTSIVGTWKCVFVYTGLGNCAGYSGMPARNGDMDSTITLKNMTQLPVLSKGQEIIKYQINYSAVYPGQGYLISPLINISYIYMGNGGVTPTGPCTPDDGEDIDIDLSTIDPSKLTTSGNQEQSVSKIISFTCGASTTGSSFFNPKYKLDFTSFGDGAVPSMSTTNPDVGVLVIKQGGGNMTPGVEYSPSSAWFYNSGNSLTFTFLPVKGASSQTPTIASGTFSASATLTIIYP